MASTKITDLTAKTSAAGTEEIPVNDSGADKKITISNVLAFNDSRTKTLTNTTIDADGTGNSITNIENADIKSGAAIAVNKLAAVTASKALVSDSSGFVSASGVSSTTLGYLDATSSVQTQLNAKQTTTLTDGNILVGNGSNVATSVTPSGAITMTNTGVFSLAKVRYLIKQNNEQITSDSTLSNDSELSMSVEANTIYYVKVLLIVQNGSSTPNFKYTLTGPSGIATGVSNSAVAANTANATNNVIGTVFTPTINSTTERYCGFEGYVTISGTPGTLAVQWAQNTSDSATTTVNKGSLLLVVKQ